MLTIDGQNMPAPAALRLSYESVGRVEVTADGSTAADRLALKRRAVITWAGLARVDCARLLTALTDSVFLTVGLPDPRAGGQVSLAMRLAGLDADLLSVDGDGLPEVCRQITADLRER